MRQTWHYSQLLRHAASEFGSPYRFSQASQSESKSETADATLLGRKWRPYTLILEDDIELCASFFQLLGEAFIDMPGQLGESDHILS